MTEPTRNPAFSQEYVAAQKALNHQRSKMLDRIAAQPMPEYGDCKSCGQLVPIAEWSGGYCARCRR